MISQIKVKNFRLLRDITLDIKPGVPVVLIGPNSSGKSSILEVLDLISFAVKNNLQDAIYKRRHGVRDIRTVGTQDDISIELLIESKDGWPTENDGSPVRYQLAFTERNNKLEITHEFLGIHKQGVEHTPFRVLERKGTKALLANIQTRTTDEIDIREELMALGNIYQSTLYPTLAHVRDILGLTTVYSRFMTAPIWGRDVQENDISPRTSKLIVPTPRINKRGIDLITALYHLHTHFPKTAWWQLQKHFKQEFPFVERLFFPADLGGGNIGLAWEDKRYPGHALLAWQMSEGMINYLCLLSAILAPDQSAALGFDEPDNHIHPSAVRRVVHLFEKRAEDTAMIIATHSNQLLDYLSDPAGSVVVCSPTEKGTSLTRLDRDTLEAWREEYSISQLREQGQVDSSNEELRNFL